MLFRSLQQGVFFQAAAIGSDKEAIQEIYAFQQGHSNAWGTNFGNRIKLQDDVNCAEYDIAVNKLLHCFPPFLRLQLLFTV